MKSMEELIQETIDGLDHFPEASLLFDREGRVIHANPRARSIFNRPLATRRDLPGGLTLGIEGALERGRRSYSCYQADGGPLLRIRTCPEYLDTAQPERPTCALLTMEERRSKSVPEFIAVALFRELRDGCVPMSTFLNNPGYAEKYQHDPDLTGARTQAEEYLYERALRVGNALLATVGGNSGARKQAPLKSLVAQAGQDNVKFYRSQFRKVTPMQLTCAGPDDLALSTGNLPRLRALVTEIFTDVLRWSKSLSVQWVEEREMLGVPMARIEFSFECFPHTLPYRTARNEGLGFDVATQIVMDANGRLELTPGKPATLCVWLPLSLPEGF
jgi:hypothetical protein